MSRPLTDRDITKAKLGAAFADFGKRMRSIDVFVFFIAGHGVTTKGDYYFIPPGFKYQGKDPVRSQGFGPSEWQAWTQQIAAEKSVLIYDTCESGSIGRAAGEPMRFASRDVCAGLTAFQRMKSVTGRTFISASSERQDALEGYNGHGLLAYTLLEAIATGDIDGNSEVELLEIAKWVGKRVPDISCQMTTKPGSTDCYRQVPYYNISGADFPLVPIFKAALPKGGSAPVAIARKPTHVLIRAENVFARKNGKGKVVLKLSPGTTVVLIGAEKGWAQISSSKGRVLGFVSETSLAKMAEAE